LYLTNGNNLLFYSNDFVFLQKQRIRSPSTNHMNRRIKVHGKVQGVFFRKNTQQKAVELGLRGWVKNEDDGSVLVEIEGELHSILAMQSWLRLGPPDSTVESLEISQGEDQGYLDFLILQ
jgi:acylphosphatase